MPIGEPVLPGCACYSAQPPTVDFLSLWACACAISVRRDWGRGTRKRCCGSVGRFSVSADWAFHPTAAAFLTEPSRESPLQSEKVKHAAKHHFLRPKRMCLKNHTLTFKKPWKSTRRLAISCMAGTGARDSVERLREFERRARRTLAVSPLLAY